MATWTTITDSNREQVKGWVEKALPGTGVSFRKGAKRTLEQNDLLWPLLKKISAKVEWSGKLRSPEDWKDLFTAALKSYEIVPGLEGGIVQLGTHTSTLTKQEMSDLLEYIFAFAAREGIDVD